MLPFMTQPALAPACYVAGEADATGVIFSRARYTHLYREAVPPTDGRKATFVWTVQRTMLGVTATLLGTSPAGATIYFDSADKLVGSIPFSSGTVSFTSAAAFRDTGGFLLIVFGIDTTRATAADRYWLEINGVRQSFSTATYPSQNDTLSSLNTAGTMMKIGGHGGSVATTVLDGVMGRAILVDGKGLVSTDFFEPNIHGVWVPKPLSLSAAQYGDNGALLDFTAPLSLGTDTSGAGHHWMASNFDVNGKDTVASTPTNVYATFNPLNSTDPAAVQHGGLRIKSPGANSIQRCTMPILFPAYWETKVVILAGDNACGISSASGSAAQAASSNLTTFYVEAVGKVRIADVIQTPAISTYGNNDILGFAFDPASCVIRVYKNGVFEAQFQMPTGVTYTPWVHTSSYVDSTNDFNFGQHPFAYTPPAGYLPLCTDNLPEPEIKDPAEAVVQVAATGANLQAVLDAATAHWNGDAYVEIVKRRDTSEDWRVRFSDDPANAWATNNADAKGAVVLTAAGSYVGYRLRVGAKYGVWTAEVEHVTGTATTVTHGLGTSRAVVVATRVNVGGGDRWMYHPDLPAAKLLRLNSDAASASGTTVTVVDGDACQIGAAAPSGTYRVMVLAQRYGLLEVYSYAGSASDLPLAPMSILPSVTLIKRETYGDPWVLFDDARDAVNPCRRYLSPNTSDGEGSGTAREVDFVVGGVKQRGHSSWLNTSGSRYVGVAIGRPIGGVCVAPATAR